MGEKSCKLSSRDVGTLCAGYAGTVGRNYGDGGGGLLV